MKYWIKAIAFDSLLALALYAWLVEGMEGAGRVALFFLWFTAVMRILVGLLGNKTMFKEVRPTGFGVYHAVSDLVVVCLIVWVEHLWLGAILAIGYFLVEAARQKEPAVKEAA